jgi:hypothetical protein
MRKIQNSSSHHRYRPVLLPHEELAMPIEYKISPDGLFVQAVAKGAVTNEDLLSYIKEIMTSTRLMPRYKELWDGTLMTKILVDKQGIDKINEFERSHRQKVAGSKCAIVVADVKAFEIAEYFEEIARANFIDVIVFNSAVTAKTWLGIGEDVMI